MLLDLFPTWWFGASFAAAAVFVIVAKTAAFKYSPALLLAAVSLVLFNAYLLGAKNTETRWQLKVAELQQKVLQAEAQSAKVNTEIVTKVVTKTQVITQKADEITKYIDREVVKYDATCQIPREVVQALNESAK